MNEAQRIAKAHRAQSALDEVGPILANLREEYTARIADVATTELHPSVRADKVTTLSVALRVLNTVEAGLREAIRDGELAKADKLRAQNIENMSDARQRLLKVAGY